MFVDTGLMAVRARRGDGAILQRAIAIEIGHGDDDAAARVGHLAAVSLILPSLFASMLEIVLCRSALVVVTVASLSEPSALKPWTVSVRLPSALTTVTSVWI
jgi:hypothetical protein